MKVIYQSKPRLISATLVALILAPAVLGLSYILGLVAFYSDKDNSYLLLLLVIPFSVGTIFGLFSIARSIWLNLRGLPVFVIGESYFLNNWSKKAYKLSCVTRSAKMYAFPLDLYLRFNNGVSAHYKGDVKTVERYDPSNFPIDVDNWIESNTVRTRKFRWKAFIVFLRAADISGRKLKELIDEHLNLDTENTGLE